MRKLCGWMARPGGEMRERRERGERQRSESSDLVSNCSNKLRPFA